MQGAACFVGVRRRPVEGTWAFACASVRCRRPGMGGVILDGAASVGGCHRKGPVTGALRLAVFSKSAKGAKSPVAAAPQGRAATRICPSKRAGAIQAIEGDTAKPRSTSSLVVSPMPAVSERTPTNGGHGFTGWRRGRLRPKEALVQRR